MKLRVLLLVFIAISSATVRLSGAPPTDVARLASRVILKGNHWTVPGLKLVDSSHPLKRTAVQIDGVTAQRSDFAVHHKPNQLHPGDRVELVFQSPEAIWLQERELVADYIRIFTAAGRTFCVWVTVHPYDYDDKTKVGGAVGAQFDLAFYDFDGDGEFETLEPASSEIGPQEWQPRLPDWAKSRLALARFPQNNSSSGGRLIR